MNRVHTFTFHLLAASLFLCACLAAAGFAQTPSPTPTRENPFAPKPAPPLPAGMTGSDVNDPRFKLSPGMFDAGEAALGLKHLALIKKPEAFQVPNDPNDPKVNRGASIIAGDPTK